MIKKFIPSLWKMKIKSILKKENKYQYLDKNKKKMIIALAADYGNLGDIAITYAQKKFIKDNFKEYEVVEYCCEDIIEGMKSLKNKITSNDVITIIGGGNMGNLYQGIEDQRKFVINNFKNNIIISFPQTIDFSDDMQGSKALKQTQKIYNKHKKLLIFARENKSYRKMKEKFNKCIVKEMPDIVLYLDKKNNEVKRNNNIIFCMRNDKEKALNKEYEKRIYDYLQQKGLNIEYQDTHIGNISLEEREEKLNEIWTKFSSSKCVITDRLHGMIFCVITGTPCIAFNNSNGKVKEVYNRWLKEIRYIKLVDKNNIEDFIEEYKELEADSDKEMNSNQMKKTFNEMKQIINDFIKNNK